MSQLTSSNALAPNNPPVNRWQILLPILIIGFMVLVCLYSSVMIFLLLLMVNPLVLGFPLAATPAAAAGMPIALSPICLFSLCLPILILLIPICIWLLTSPKVRALIAFLRIGMQLMPKLPVIANTLLQVSSSINDGADLLWRAYGDVVDAFASCTPDLRQISVPTLEMDTVGFYDLVKGAVVSMHIPVVEPSDQVKNQLNRFRVPTKGTLDFQEDPFGNYALKLNLESQTLDANANQAHDDLKEAAQFLRDIAVVLNQAAMNN